MTRFRRLPPVLRMASLLRPLFPLGLFVAFALIITAGVWSSGHEGVYGSRVVVIALNLSLLGLGCTLVVRVYNARFRQPGREPFPLESWQSQVRTTLMLTAIPVCTLVFALVIPPTAGAFELVFPASLIGVFVCLAVALSMGIGQGVGA